MKKNISILLIALLCFSLVGCGKTYKGTDELMQKAREELPVSDADTIDLMYVGMSDIEDKALVWYISGNEFQAHYYLPMEVSVKNNRYSFVHTYKPMTDICADVAVVNWHQGYAFLVNNPKVETVQITLQNGEVNEEVVQEIPYTFYVRSVPSEYIFLDAEGNEVQ